MLFFQIYFLIWTLMSATCVGGNKDELLQLLQKAAGVYKDESRITSDDLKKTVLITGCNFGFVNHLQNFKCFADRLGMKFLVIAMDKIAHNYITQNTTMSSYLMTGGAVGEVTGDSTEFRSKQFNLITARKKEAVHDILSLGFNVIFSDTDVAMVQDPVPYMLWENVDYVHSLNYMCKIGETWDFHKSKIEGNTGFYFVRSNPNTIKLWAHAFEAAPKYPKLDDQAIFWKVIRTSTDPPVLPLPVCRHFNSAEDKLSKATVKNGAPGSEYLVSCMLDTCAFSSGMLSRVYVPELTYGMCCAVIGSLVAILIGEYPELLLENLKALNQSIVTLHANYISGNKKKMNRMREYGFWLAGGGANGEDRHHGTQQCAEYVPHIPVTAVRKL